jgi:DNA transposition AAA+ family ATPase
MNESTISRREKRDIAFRLREFVNSFSSQKKASQNLQNVSEATVIAMLTENEFGWEKISDEMWRNVSKQVAGSVDFSNLVETLNFQTLILYFTIAREEGASFAFVGNAGWGKSYTAKYYAAMNRRNNVYYLECAEYWNKKMFLQKILMQMGKSGNGMQIGEMMELLIWELKKQHQPLIIMDEVDKLNEPCLKFFITLYNQLNKHCGLVWLSTNAIEKKIIKGINKNSVGYQEIYSRIGATFISLRMPSADEVSEICSTHGIKSKEMITAAINEVRDLHGDLRRVDRIILKQNVRGRKLNAA